jgi:hypothetical protein
MKHEVVKTKIRDFLLAKGGPFRITEADKTINDLNRSLISALYEDYKKGVELICFRENRRVEYTPGMKICNFSFDAVQVKERDVAEYLIWV